MIDLTFVPLLSKKPIEEFSPEGYHNHIKSLYHKPEPKKGSGPKRPFSVQVNKKGTLIIRFNRLRTERYLTQKEMFTVCEESGKTQAEVFLKMKEKKIELKGE